MDGRENQTSNNYRVPESILLNRLCNANEEISIPYGQKCV